KAGYLDDVFAARIARVKAEDIRRIHEAHLLPAELPLLICIQDIPVELLADDTDHRGLPLVGKLVHCLGPQRHGKKDEQRSLDRRHRDLKVARSVAPHPDVIRLGIASAAEADQRVSKIKQPAREQRGHQPVHIDDQVIDMLPMFRRHRRQPQECTPIHIQTLSVDSTFAAATEAADTAADFFPRNTKNEVTPPSTTATTPNRLKMPQFMPLAIAESD